MEKNSIKGKGEYITLKKLEGKWLGYWLNEDRRKYAVGQTIEVEGVEKNDYTAKDGSLKTAYNLLFPKTNFQEILKRIETLEGEVTKLKLTKADKAPDYPNFEGQPDFGEKEEEVPF